MVASARASGQNRRIMERNLVKAVARGVDIPRNQVTRRPGERGMQGITQAKRAAGHYGQLPFNDQFLGGRQLLCRIGAPRWLRGRRGHDAAVLSGAVWKKKL